MISWNTKYINGDEDIKDDSVYCTSYTELPVLSDLSEDELLCIAEDGKIKDIIRGLPCPNQRVERTIRLVSQTSQKSAKKVDREGIIQTVISSRADLPKFESKFQFKVKLEGSRSARKRKR